MSSHFYTTHTALIITYTMPNSQQISQSNYQLTTWKEWGYATSPTCKEWIAVAITTRYNLVFCTPFIATVSATSY